MVLKKNLMLFWLLALTGCDAEIGEEAFALEKNNKNPGIEVASVGVASTVSPPPKYAVSCGACHSVGVAGAPVTGNKEDWETRMNKGMDALVASSRNGLNAMPPGGLCNECSDQEYVALITYMATPK